MYRNGVAIEDRAVVLSFLDKWRDRARLAARAELAAARARQRLNVALANYLMARAWYAQNHGAPDSEGEDFRARRVAMVVGCSHKLPAPNAGDVARRAMNEIRNEVPGDPDLDLPPF
jgi:hypothetical protein